MDDMILVRGLVGCGGLWGTISEGETRKLPRDIAESLMRAGYAEPVVTDGAAADVTREIEKKEGSRRIKKSKTASAS